MQHAREIQRVAVKEGLAVVNSNEKGGGLATLGVFFFSDSNNVKEEQ